MDWLDYDSTKSLGLNDFNLPGKKNRWRTSQGPFLCWLRSRVIVLKLPQGEKFHSTPMFVSRSLFCSGKLPLFFFYSLDSAFSFNVFVLEMFGSSGMCRRRLERTAALSTLLRIGTDAQAPGSPLYGCRKGNRMFSQFGLFHRHCRLGQLDIGTQERIWTDSDIWWSVGWYHETTATPHSSLGLSLSSVSAKLSYIWPLVKLKSQPSGLLISPLTL